MLLTGCSASPSTSRAMWDGFSIPELHKESRTLFFQHLIPRFIRVKHLAWLVLLCTTAIKQAVAVMGGETHLKNGLNPAAAAAIRGSTPSSLSYSEMFF